MEACKTILVQTHECNYVVCALAYTDRSPLAGPNSKDFVMNAVCCSFESADTGWSTAFVFHNHEFMTHKSVVSPPG